MVYAVTNPPMLIAQRLGDGPAMWAYKSADAKATVNGASYITNAAAGTNSPNTLGMKVGDIVFAYDTANAVVSVHSVSTINATTGAATLIFAVVA